jgi:multimeric flavodoxin WrbA
MKVIVIMGSPRKGNTYRAVRRIEEHMKGMGVPDFEYLWLKDAGLTDCKGCMTCFLKGEQRCPLKDGREEIEKKMLEADGVIFASPNYASNVSGLMKTFIDRFAFAGHRPGFYEQYALYVSTSAGPGGLKECLAAMQGPVSHFGFRTAGTLGLMTPPFKVPQNYADKNEKAIAAASQKLYNAIINKGPATPDLMGVIGFRSIQTMCNKMGDMYNEIYPADLQYWKEKGWLDRSKYYYTDAKISPVKKALARIAVTTIMLYLGRTLFAEAGKKAPVKAEAAVDTYGDGNTV